MIHCDLSHARTDISDPVLAEKVQTVHEWLHHPQTSMCGWVHLPEDMDTDTLNDLEQLAQKVRNACDTFVICGIGGSYLGTRAGLDLLQEPFRSRPGCFGAPDILFAGQHLSSGYHQALFSYLESRDFYLCIVSKSGSTLETTVISTMLMSRMKRRWPDSWQSRVIIITDPEHGKLRTLAEKESIVTLDIPANVGGRYSVLSAVGLFPFAVAGLDIHGIIAGAREAQQRFQSPALKENPCYSYAAARYLLKERGYEMEVFEVYEGRMRYFTEWLRQLFAESECKNGGGLFPVAMQMSTDLHSLGQFLQDGRQNFLETILSVASFSSPLIIPDGCAGHCHRLDCLNRIIADGVREAHSQNQTPIITLSIKDLTAASFGYLVYFFEKACAMSAALSGTNPFDQPGVEAYKRYVNEAILSIGEVQDDI